MEKQKKPMGRPRKGELRKTRAHIITLTPAVWAYLEEKVSAGGYRSVAAYIQADYEQQMKESEQ